MAAAAVALSLLSACGHGGPPSSARPPITPVINEYVPATGAEFAAGAAVRRTESELEYKAAARCMTGQGLTAPADTAAAVTAGDVDNSEFPDLARIAATSRFIPAAARLPAQVSQDSAFGACAQKAAALFRPADAAGQALQAQWMNAVAQAEESSPVRALLPAYQACLASAGVPASEAHSGTAAQSASSSANALGNFLAWETGQESEYGTSAAHWARIFVRCARPVVQETEKEQLKAKAAFLAGHSQQVRELEKESLDETRHAEQEYGRPPA